MVLNTTQTGQKEQKRDKEVQAYTVKKIIDGMMVMLDRLSVCCSCSLQVQYI